MDLLPFVYLKLNLNFVAQGEENVASLKRQLGKLFEVSLRAVAPDEPNVEPVVVPSAGRFGDYQWYTVGFV